MAEVIATSYTRSAPGEFTLTIIVIPNTADDTNTVETKIQGIVSAMACPTDTASEDGDTAFGVSVTDVATGQLTLHIGEANSAGTIWVLSRS